MTWGWKAEWQSGSFLSCSLYLYRDKWHWSVTCILFSFRNPRNTEHQEDSQHGTDIRLVLNHCLGRCSITNIIMGHNIIMARRFHFKISIFILPNGFSSCHCILGGILLQKLCPALPAPALQMQAQCNQAVTISVLNLAEAAHFSGPSCSRQDPGLNSHLLEPAIAMAGITRGIYADPCTATPIYIRSHPDLKPNSLSIEWII